jgi:hypothetical protein
VSSEAVYTQHEILAARTMGSQIGRAIGDQSASVGWIVWDDENGDTWSRTWTSTGIETDVRVEWPEEQ